eukprot:3938102-Rhodomonas_salina.3
MPCHAMPCHAVPCDAMRCDAVPCGGVGCSAMQCDAMQCIALRGAERWWVRAEVPTVKHGKPGLPRRHPTLEPGLHSRRVGCFLLAHDGRALRRADCDDVSRWLCLPLTACVFPGSEKQKFIVKGKVQGQLGTVSPMPAASGPGFHWPWDSGNRRVSNATGNPDER